MRRELVCGGCGCPVLLGEDWTWLQCPFCGGVDLAQPYRDAD